MSVVGGASTQSRMSHPGRKVNIVRVSGSHQWTSDSRSILSWPMGQYGPLLGFPSLYNPHAADLVNYLAYKMRSGKASLGDYAPEEEEELADILVRRFLPWTVSENLGVRFFSNGTDATQAAVALARYVTGRNHIISIGYHGGSSPVFSFPPQCGGVLIENRVGYKTDVEFSDYLVWREKQDGQIERRVAAVVVEIPSVESDEQAKGILAQIEADCRNHGILLVMDEIVTGFRLSSAGALGYYGNILADFVCLGKAMSTYGKVSALIGPKSIMENLQKNVFASYTYNDHAFGIIDSIQTIRSYDVRENDLFDYINGVGEMLKSGLNAVFAERGFGATVYGHPSRTAIKTDMPTNVYLEFLGRLVDEKNILIHRPNFATLAHTPESVEITVRAAMEVLDEMGFG